ncbi:Zn-dependent peptidase ImmA, M78 family [Desulfocicer vacuolatum DSM 3385]|uniref:Zn-dependent peptidase ImmA, M78 family n=1 Tax=Desulfocicer vacuolatum DSM 3385 TaxID=1121400 RepID=A0A1W2BZN6_9BACT|nr:XRE family transcriptional regulator [Desulfocicer vacuolatum]SMC78214.1 Zn-dependent peptidase ImmA, M78 family [Desulfocicer vacuolatum DSM 3385]
MINEFGRRLYSARKMAGLSMAALAEKSGAVVSKQAISKYEKGQINPGSEVLIALAKTLDVKVDYFFKPSQIAIAGLEFRKRSKLTKKAEEQIKYKTLDFLQKYLEVEEILNIRTPYVNPVSQPLIKTQADIEAAAQEIREKWKLGQGPIPHLIELLENKGFKVFEVCDFEHFDGLSGFVSEIDLPVVAVYKNSNLVRKRFTVAHELGHLLLNFSQAEGQNVEKLCHSFAGALLLPEAVMRKELGQKRSKITLWELKKLKGVFGISIQAIMARARSLSIISATTYKSFCIYARKKGWHKDEPGEYRGREVANRFKQIVYHGTAEEIISFSKAAGFLNKSVSQLDQEVKFIV